MSCALRHTPSGKRHASCGGCARAYGHGPETRPQVAAGVARVAAAPTAEVADLKPARDDSAKAQSGHQQRGTATRALQGPAPPRSPPDPAPPIWAHHGPRPCACAAHCGGGAGAATRALQSPSPAPTAPWPNPACMGAPRAAAPRSTCYFKNGNRVYQDLRAH
jgi:hypothetical protein